MEEAEMTEESKMNKNWNCDGGHCTDPNSETRVYPLGGGANLILCMACFAHENRHRVRRGRAIKQPEYWPQVNWVTAKRYPETESSHGNS